MKKMNNKGFTIVELVIVIAVIAILAAVMIPTFSGVVQKANQTAVQQKAAAVFKEVYAADLSDGLCNAEDASGSTAKSLASGSGTGYTYTYTVASGDVDEFVYVESSYTATFDGDKWIVDETPSNP